MYISADVIDARVAHANKWREIQHTLLMSAVELNVHVDNCLLTSKREYRKSTFDADIQYVIFDAIGSCGASSYTVVAIAAVQIVKSVSLSVVLHWLGRK